MGLDPRQLPERVKERMDPGDKAAEVKRLGRRAMETGKEARERESLRLEREDHAQFAGYLKSKGIEFEHDDPTKRSTNRKGWPDFRIFMGPPPVVLFLEFKRRPNKLSAEQEQIKVYLERAGYSYQVAWSLLEAIEFVRKKGLPLPIQEG